MQKHEIENGFFLLHSPHILLGLFLCSKWKNLFCMIFSFTANFISCRTFLNCKRSPSNLVKLLNWRCVCVLKGQCSSLILDFLKFFFQPNLIFRHQGSISLFGTDLVLGLLTKVIDASRSGFCGGNTIRQKLRVFWLYSLTGNTQVNKLFKMICSLW